MKPPSSGMIAFAGNLPGLQVGGWLGLLPVAGAGGEGAGLFAGPRCCGLVCPFGVRAGAVGGRVAAGCP